MRSRVRILIDIRSKKSRYCLCLGLKPAHRATHKRGLSCPTNSDTTKHDRLGDSRCDVLSSSVETRPEPDGTRRQSTADRESRMKSRASRSSESSPRPAVSETPRPRRARRGRGRREHLARRPRRLPPSGRWRATTQAWQRPARALLSVTREARGSEAFTFRDARGRTKSIHPVCQISVFQLVSYGQTVWQDWHKRRRLHAKNTSRPIGGSTVTRGAHARPRPCLPTLATRDVSRTRPESASRSWLTNPTVQVGKRPTRSRCPRFSCLTTARPSSPPRPPPASGSGP